MSETARSKAPPEGDFIAALEPLFKLGPSHPVPKAVLNALASEANFLALRATDLGTKGEERVWYAGAASAVSTLAGEILARLNRLQEIRDTAAEEDSGS